MDLGRPETVAIPDVFWELTSFDKEGLELPVQQVFRRPELDAGTYGSRPEWARSAGEVVRVTYVYNLRVADGTYNVTSDGVAVSKNLFRGLGTFFFGGFCATDNEENAHQ